MTPFSQPEDLYRFARSPEETVNYRPNWRALQATQYNEFSGRNPDAAFTLPGWEDDRDVISYYTFLKYRTVGNDYDDARLFYAYDASLQNEAQGGAARLKTMLIAGYSIEEIAGMLETRIQNVETFCSLFFDVGQWLDNEHFISQVAQPFITPKSESMWSRRERLWLASAFLLKKKGAESALLRKVELTEAEQEGQWRALTAMINAQGVDFAISRRGGMLPNSEDFDRLVMLKQMAMAEPPPSSSKANEYDVKGVRAVRGKQAYIPRNRAAISFESSDSDRKAVIAAMKRVPSGEGLNSYFVN